MNPRAAAMSFRPNSCGNLDPIDISSSGPTSRFYSKCARNGHGWDHQLPPPLFAQDAFVNEESLNSVCKSWCLSMTAFIACRVAVFQYLLATFFVLVYKGAVHTFPLSMAVYALQVSAALVAVCTSVGWLWGFKRDVREKKGYLTPPAGKDEIPCVPFQWPETRMEKFQRQVKTAIETNCRTASLAIAGLLVQNCSSIVLLWNLLLWTKSSSSYAGIASDKVVFVLLHLFNLVPVFFDILAGSSVFKMIDFIPGAAAVAGMLMKAGAYSGMSSEAIPAVVVDLQTVVKGLGEGETKPYLQISILYIYICGGLVLVQKLRHIMLQQSGGCKGFINL